MRLMPISVVASLVIAGFFAATPARAQLLGGDGLVGSITETVATVVTVTSGPSSSESSVINVSIGNGGGDNGHVLGVQSGGALGGVVNVALGSTDGGLQLGAGALGYDMNVNLAGGRNGTSGGPGSPGAAGRNGTTGTNGVLGGAAGIGPGFQLAGACSIAQGRELLKLAASARADVRSWRRAANVQVVPVKLCASTRNQVASALNASPKILGLQNAAAGDALIAASLQRTRYGAEDVFAVHNAGGTLTVYVY